MDSCLYVEQEVDKIITKLNSINDCASKALYDIIKHVKNLQHESESCKYTVFLHLKLNFEILLFFNV